MCRRPRGARPQMSSGCGGRRQEIPHEGLARTVWQREERHHCCLEAVAEAASRLLATLGGVVDARVESACVQREGVVLHDDELVGAHAQRAHLVAGAHEGQLGRRRRTPRLHTQAECGVEAPRCEEVEVVDSVLKELAQRRPQACP